MIIKPPFEPIRPKFREKLLWRLLASPFQREAPLFISVAELMAVPAVCHTDAEYRLYWYSNLFLRTQKQGKQKPQHLNNAEARCLVELPSVKGSQPFNSQISIG